MASSARTGRGPARLGVLALGVLAIAAVLAAFLGLRQSAAQAPPEEISNAELLTRVANAADDPPQLSATVTVEQDLIPAQLLDSMAGGGEGGPSMSMASEPQTARVWYGGEERVRAELLGENGDKVFVGNGARVTVYDGAENVVRTGTAPEGTPDEPAADGAVDPAEVNELLAELEDSSVLSQGTPTTYEGRGAHVLTLAPRDAGSTLVERAEAVVDAETYLPLSLALFADGTPEPVMSYRLSEISVGPVAGERFRFETPPGARVLPLDEGREHRGDRKDRGGDQKDRVGVREVASVAEAQEAAGFGVRQLGTAPGGRGLSGVYLAPQGGVVLTYGEDWGTVVLSQQPDENAQGALPPPRTPEGLEEGQPGEGLDLPTVDFGGGVEARVLSTPVGTVLLWEEGGVRYVLAGSAPAAELEQAARGLR